VAENGDRSPFYPAATTGFEDPVGFDDGCLVEVRRAEGPCLLKDDACVTATIFSDVSGPNEASSTLSNYAQCYDDGYCGASFRIFTLPPSNTTNKWIIVYESTAGKSPARLR
jgi:hypothetical protein